jgi:hypothetical protein
MGIFEENLLLNQCPSGEASEGPGWLGIVDVVGREQLKEPHFEIEIASQNHLVIYDGDGAIQFR